MYVSLSVTIDPKYKSQLEKEAKKEEISVSQIIRKLLKDRYK